jgi:Cu-Zn family superoxide dismutase
MPRPLPLVLALSLALAGGAGVASAAQVKAKLFLATADGKGAEVGSVRFRDAKGGAQIRADLHGLPPGQHGFHVHDKGSCDPAMKDGKATPAGAAGGHMDPAMSGKHEGPSGMGHLGDLPFLTVAADGSDKETLTAPRITSVKELKGRAVMIHAGGDNYSDQPAPLGGGGARLACGVLATWAP